MNKERVFKSIEHCKNISYSAEYIKCIQEEHNKKLSECKSKKCKKDRS